MFGSACFTYQHGTFRELHWDLSRIDVKLNIPELMSLYKVKNARDAPPPPSLNLIFQQQVKFFLCFFKKTQLFSWCNYLDFDFDSVLCSSSSLCRSLDRLFFE